MPKERERMVSGDVEKCKQQQRVGGGERGSGL